MTASPDADQSLHAAALTLASPQAALDWGKGQPERMRALHAGLLGAAETRLRWQADFLGEQSRCTSIPDMLAVQTDHVRDLWADTLRDAQKNLVLSRSPLGGRA